jgi:hypothetical protein
MAVARHAIPISKSRASLTNRVFSGDSSSIAAYSRNLGKAGRRFEVRRCQSVGAPTSGRLEPDTSSAVRAGWGRVDFVVEYGTNDVERA